MRLHLHKSLYCGLLALSLAYPPAAAFAQTATEPQPQLQGIAPQEDVIKEDLFTVTPVLETELSSDQAVPLELRFAAQPNTSSDVKVDGIVAEGFTRYVTVNGEQIAQVVVTRLKKDENFVDLDADQFTSQFGIEETRLVPNTSVTVDGDEAEFVRAVASLNAEPEADKPAEEATDTEDTAAESSNVNEGGSDNPIASGYETPERLPEDEPAPERDPNVTFNVSTDGCEPEIDLANGIVRQTAKSETLEDGIVTETEACSSNGIVWNIQRNYEACEDLVDKSGLIARPQYLSYYNDDKGARYDLAGCQPDPSVSFTISESTDKCKPEVDLDNEQVTLLSRLTYRDRSGKEVAVSECAKSDTAFEMERSYGTCADLVDLDAKTAHAQFTLSYTDEEASRHTVSECVPDEKKTYPIEEKQNCTLEFDFDGGQAIVNTSLVYETEEGVEVSVRECAASETVKPIKMTADTSNCTLRHDFGAGISTEMAMWTYEQEGQLFQASPCITTDTTYSHARVFEKNGIDVCTPIVDLTKGQAARQYRTEITVDGRTEVIAGCQPDESAMLAIQATTDGCEDPASFDHDLAAGVSYGRERFYYNVPGQGRIYVTGCQRNEQTFTHSIKPAGWKYNDSKLRAQQLVDVSINVNGAAYQIATSYLQPGTSEVAYTFLSNQDTPDYSKKYYDGCNEMVPTKRTKIYARPDGSSYALPSGSGPTLNNGDKCSRSTETRKLEGYRVVLYAKGGRIDVRDGHGNETRLYGDCRGASKTLTGDPTYSVVRVMGNKQLGQEPCAGQKLSMTYYHRIDERSKVVYPTGEVTYSSWKTIRWET